MAKKVENKDLFAADLMGKTIKDVELLIVELDKLEAKIVTVAKAQKTILAKEDNKTIGSIQRTTKAVNQLSEAEKIQQTLLKQRSTLETKLKAARTSQASSNAQLNLLVKEQTRLVNEDAKAELKRLGVIKLTAAEQRKLERETERQNNAYKKLTATTNNAQMHFKRLAVQYGINSKQANIARQRFEALDNKLRQVNNAARDGRRDVGRYGLALDKVGGFLRSGLGALGITAGIAGVARLMTSTIAIFRDFEAANSKLQSVLGATTVEMKSLSDQAKELGSSTSFTASQVTELQTEFAKLGFPTKEILNMTESTLAAAAAMGSGLGEQAALTGATIKAFGLDSKDAARVNDVLAKSTARSALDFSKLNASMSTIAPVANAMGFGLEDTVSLLGNLSDSGFDASTAATATRNIMLKLADSSSVLGKRLKEPVKDLPSLIRGLKQLTNEGVDLSEALELTDVRSVAAFSTFLKGTDSLEKLSAELNNAEGSAKAMADTMLDNLSGDITIAESAWEGFILSLEDGSGVISQALRGITQFATETLSALTNLNKSAKQLAEEGVNRLHKEAVETGTETANELKKQYEKIGLSGKELEAALLRAFNQARDFGREAKERGDNELATTYFAEAVALKDMVVSMQKTKEATEAQTNAQKKGTKALKDYRKELEDVQNRLIKDDLDREIAQIETEFKRKIDAIKGNSKVEQDLREALRKERNRKEDAAIKKYQDELFKKEQERANAQNKIIDDLEIAAMEEGVEKQKALRQQQFEEKIAQLEKDGLLTAEIEKALQAELIRDLNEIQLNADKKADNDRFEIEKKQLEEEARIRKELTEAGLQVIEDLVNNYYDKQLKALDKQLEKTGERVDFLREKAKNSMLASEESLAFEQKKEAELEQQRIKTQKEQQRVQALMTVISTYNAELNSGKNAGQALQSTITNTAVLKALAGTLEGFYEGTDDVGKSLGKPQLKGKDGHIVRVDGKEQIWSDKDRKAVGYRDRDEIKGIVSIFDSGVLDDIMKYDKSNEVINPNAFAMNGMSLKMISKLEQISENIKGIQIPEGTVNIDEVRKLITLTTKKGNRIKKERSKLFN